MVSDNQKAQVQKTLDAIKQGIKPPACQPNPPGQSGKPGQPGQSSQTNQSSQSGQGLQPCDQYCADPTHVEECVKFSVAMGNMTEQQAQTAIKNGNKGPGGCIGKDACDAFCNNPDNQETCFNFAKDNGMVPQDQLQQMQASQQKMKDSFSQIPAEVLTCITNSAGADVVEEMKSGSFIPSQSGEAINQCFRNYAPQNQVPNQNQPGQPGQGGPNNMPGDLRDCLQSQVGEDGLAKIQSGNVDDPVLMEKAKTCFDKYGQPGQSNQPMNPGQPNQSGQSGSMQPMMPGVQFASGTGPNVPSSPQQGVMSSGTQFAPRTGPSMPPPNFQNNFPGGPASGTTIVGPGGCKTPQECAAFCASNPQICNNFQPPSSGQQGQMQPMMPPQGMKSGTEFASGTSPNMPPQEGMPLNPTTPLNETKSPPGGTQPQSGTQEMIPQGGMQPFVSPPPPPAPGTTSTTSGLQNQEFLGALIELFRPVFGL